MRNLSAAITLSVVAFVINGVAFALVLQGYLPFVGGLLALVSTIILGVALIMMVQVNAALRIASREGDVDSGNPPKRN